VDVADPQTDPLTGQIDLDLINTGAGSATRRIRGDLKREVCPSFHIPDYASPPLHYTLHPHHVQLNVSPQLTRLQLTFR
jgi:hypothetical protein